MRKLSPAQHNQYFSLPQCVGVIEANTISTDGDILLGSGGNKLVIWVSPGRYMFRIIDEFVPPEWRLRAYQNSFLPFAVSLWNSLEEDTRSISNYEIFKDTLMGNVNDNPLFHSGTRQEQIIMARLIKNAFQ